MQWLPSPSISGSFSCVAYSMEAVDDALTKVLFPADGGSAMVTMALPMRRMLTLHCFAVTEVDPLFLSPTKESKIVDEQPCTAESCHRVIEVCSGIGGIGMGASACGFAVAALLDHNQLVCDALLNLGHENIHEASLLDDKALRDLHLSIQPVAHVMTSGFSCQPWSFQGDQGGFADTRASSFWGTLRAFHLLQMKVLILECTPAAGQNPRLRNALLDFATCLNLQFKDVNLSLADQWPSHRNRWWALLYPKDWPTMDLISWGKGSYALTVQQVVPSWPSWMEDESAPLRLTEHEMQLYMETYPDKKPDLAD